MGATLSFEQREANRLRSLRWGEEHRDVARQRARDWYAANKGRVSERDRLKYAAEREQRIPKMRARYVENRDEILAARRALAADHPQRVASRERTKAWAKANPDRKRVGDLVSVRKRQAAKAKRTPAWLTKDDHATIANIYREAAALKASTGQDWHVDHVIPLRGRTVNGLHVPSNLQVIPGRDNLAKGNRYGGAA